MAAVSQIQQLPIRDLKPNPKNVRTHSRRQIGAIAKSIKQAGFITPIIADENGVILAGHGRWQAANQLRLRTVPVITVSGLSDVERRAYVLADNKLAERAGWDRPALALELNALAPLLAEHGLEIQLTGFEPAEIDSLMGDLIDRDSDPDDEIPEIANAAVSRTGDLWQASDHRILCGNALQDRYLRKLMNGHTAAMVFTDPPYNLKICSIGGRGKIRHPEFRMASGEMSQAQYEDFLFQVMSLLVKHSSKGSIHFIFNDWRHMREMSLAGEKAYTELKNLIVWAKTNAGQGTFYRSQHELIWVFKNGDAAHINNFELGQYGRNRTNIWDGYPGANSFRTGRLEDLTLHPTVKPVALVAEALRDCSRRGDIILDPFLGSGTTVLAAERVGRASYGLELDPLYVDVAVRRWQAYTKRDAVLLGTRSTFDEVSAARHSTLQRRK
jgi:DNA modification methylase